MWAKFRGARLVINIDEIEYRLNAARNKAGADIVINYKK